MKKQKALEIIDDILKSADVEKSCGIYDDMIERGHRASADKFKLWADTWIVNRLIELKKLIV